MVHAPWVKLTIGPSLSSVSFRKFVHRDSTRIASSSVLRLTDNKTNISLEMRAHDSTCPMKKRKKMSWPSAPVWSATASASSCPGQQLSWSVAIRSSSEWPAAAAIRSIVQCSSSSIWSTVRIGGPAPLRFVSAELTIACLSRDADS